MPAFAWKSKHSSSRSSRNASKKAATDKSTISSESLKKKKKNDDSSATGLSELCTSPPTNTWGMGTEFHESYDDPLISYLGTPLEKDDEDGDEGEEIQDHFRPPYNNRNGTNTTQNSKANVEDTTKHSTMQTLEQRDTDGEEELTNIDSKYGGGSTFENDNDSLALRDQHSRESRDDPTTINFMTELMNGKVWEDGTSPIDFVVAVGTGEVWHDLFHEKSTSNNNPEQEGKPTIATKLLVTLGEFVEGEEPTVQIEASRSPSPTPSRREQARAMNSSPTRHDAIFLDTPPSTKRDLEQQNQKTLTKQSRRDIGESPNRNARSVRSASPTPRKVKLVVGKSDTHGSSEKGSRLAREISSGSPSPESDSEKVKESTLQENAMECCLLVADSWVDINESMMCLLLGNDISGRHDSQPPRSPSTTSSSGLRKAILPSSTKSTSNLRERGRSPSPRRSRGADLAAHSETKNNRGRRSTVSPTKRSSTKATKTRSASVRRGAAKGKVTIRRPLPSSKKVQRRYVGQDQVPNKRRLRSPSRTRHMSPRRAPATRRGKHVAN